MPYCAISKGLCRHIGGRNFFEPGVRHITYEFQSLYTMSLNSPVLQHQEQDSTHGSRNPATGLHREIDAEAQ